MPSTITFVLKEPKSTEPTLIYLIIRHNSYKVDATGKKFYNQIKFSTGLKWNPAYWDTKKHRGISKKGFPDPAEFNQRLLNMESAAADVYRRLVNDGTEISAQTFASALEKRKDIFPDLKRRSVNPAALKKNPESLFGFLEEYARDIKFVYKRGKPYPISNRTKQKYSTTLGHLKTYAATRRKGLDFADIDLEFYQDFVDFLRTKLVKKATKKNPDPTEVIHMTDNSVGKHITTLKTMLNAATEAGVNTNMKFHSKKFATLFEDVDKIYLTENELLKIYQFDLSVNQSLDRVRDLFLIGCYTCLRFSDFTTIHPENIYTTDKGTFIKIEDMKTGTKVVIPLHWIVAEILKKYNYDLPRSISNQKMNDYIKIVGKKAGINEMVSITRVEGGVKISRTRPKHELITTHTARRSGATNMFLAGIQSISIMILTGHKTEKSFMRYIQMTPEDNANKLMENPFFKKSNVLKIV